jgi:hypothetical protein
MGSAGGNDAAWILSSGASMADIHAYRGDLSTILTAAPSETAAMAAVAPAGPPPTTRIVFIDTLNPFSATSGQTIPPVSVSIDAGAHRATGLHIMRSQGHACKASLIAMKRAFEREILDRPDVPDELANRAYRELTRIHRYLGDTAFVVEAIRHDPMPVRRVLGVPRRFRPRCQPSMIAARGGGSYRRTTGTRRGPYSVRLSFAY